VRDRIGGCVARGNRLQQESGGVVVQHHHRSHDDDIPRRGRIGSISVNTSASCAWTATSNASFLTVTQGASGMGDGTVQFAVAPNTGAERTATLTITRAAITITRRAP
jgi:hypothetical protein